MVDMIIMTMAVNPFTANRNSVPKKLNKKLTTELVAGLMITVARKLTMVDMMIMTMADNPFTTKEILSKINLVNNFGFSPNPATLVFI